MSLLKHPNYDRFLVNMLSSLLEAAILIKFRSSPPCCKYLLTLKRAYKRAGFLVFLDIYIMFIETAFSLTFEVILMCFKSMYLIYPYLPPLFDSWLICM